MLYDVTIIGGGIVGAATALQIKKSYPLKKVLLLEKEPSAACHQTGRNSGVIHAGVYYPADSLKAQFCRQGVTDTVNFCNEYNIDYDQCGKLLVATDETEMTAMEASYQRCEDNGLEPELLSRAKLREKEPNITGVGGFLVRQTGIVNYKLITQAMLGTFQKLGGVVFYNQEVNHLRESPVHVEITTAENSFNSRLLVNCGGLMTDRLMDMMGVERDFQIIPFRGEYYRLPAKFNQVVKHLIYPTPNPELPFLGVHLTRMIDGSVTVGPNAVLAFKREGYRKIDFSPSDMKEMLTFSGFWPLVKRFGKSGLQELKNSFIKEGYLEQVQKYCPQISKADLLPYPSGVRAQAVSRNGELIHDFKFCHTPLSLHIGNAPSPAATSAIPIARYIVSQLENKLA